MTSPSDLPQEQNPQAVAEIAKSMDQDCDGISDYYDKCLTFPSKNNKDSDGDGFGDVCDTISSDLAVKMVASQKSVRVGEIIRFSIIITNYGPKEDAEGIEIDASFPASLKVNSLTTTNGKCDEYEGSVLCDAGPLPVGRSTTIQVLATAIRVRTVTSSVRVENGIGDLNRRNNFANRRITVIR